MFLVLDSFLHANAGEVVGCERGCHFAPIVGTRFAEVACLRAHVVLEAGARAAIALEEFREQNGLFLVPDQEPAGIG